MTTYTGTAGNDSWNLITPGTFTLDGLGGTDTLNLGTSLRSSYAITKTTDGAVHVDSISGASGVLHATLLNMETLTFNSGKDKLDLTTYFGATAPPPTVSITGNISGTATGNMTYALAFSETVSGLAAGDFTVTRGNVVSVSGSGSAYSVVVAPAANTEDTLGFALNAGAVLDASGNTNAATAAAAQIIDTKAPTVSNFSPATQATGVFTNSNIVLTFSESVQRGNGNITLKTSDGTVVASYDAATSGNLSISASTLTIQPTSELGAVTNYTLQFAAGSIKDLAGNSYAGTSAYSFATAAGALLVAPTGNNTLTGGTGIDTVVFSGTKSQYQISQNAGSIQINGPTGTDTLNHIDRVQFSDTKRAMDLDVSQSGGEVALLIGAVLGKSSLTDKALVGQLLQFFDAGNTMHDAANALVNAGIMDQLAGGADTNSYVNLIFHAVVGQVATPDVTAQLAAYINTGGYTKADFLTIVADLSINQTNVDLVGLHQTGLEYS